MEDTLYYTHSTIAQVMAAFLALSGVFLVYLYPKIDEKILKFGYRAYFELRDILKITTPTPNTDSAISKIHIDLRDDVSNINDHHDAGDTVLLRIAVRKAMEKIYKHLSTLRGHPNVRIEAVKASLSIPLEMKELEVLKKRIRNRATISFITGGAAIILSIFSLMSAHSISWSTILYYAFSYVTMSFSLICAIVSGILMISLIEQSHNLSKSIH